MRGFFDLKCPQDLLAKLERDYAHLCAAPSDTDTAFNFFVTGWHLLEWQYPDAAGMTAQRTRIRDEHPILQVAEHLAVGAKHFQPTKARLKSVERSEQRGAWADGSWAPGTWKDGAWANVLVVELDGDARVAFGERTTVPELAERLMKYWRIESGLVQSEAT